MLNSMFQNPKALLSHLNKSHSSKSDLILKMSKLILKIIKSLNYWEWTPSPTKSIACYYEPGPQFPHSFFAANFLSLAPMSAINFPVAYKSPVNQRQRILQRWALLNIWQWVWENCFQTQKIWWVFPVTDKILKLWFVYLCLVLVGLRISWTTTRKSPNLRISPVTGSDADEVY